MSLTYRKSTPKTPVWEAALNLLARREHSRAELAKKLTMRGYARADIEAALDALVAQGLLSEARYVASYVQSRIERGYGPHRILAELRQRGVEASVAQELLDAGGECWLERAREYYRRHFGSPPADYRERGQRWRHMQQRGFDAGTLRTLLGDRDDEDGL